MRQHHHCPQPAPWWHSLGLEHHCPTHCALSHNTTTEFSVEETLGIFLSFGGTPIIHMRIIIIGETAANMRKACIPAPFCACRFANHSLSPLSHRKGYYLLFIHRNVATCHS